MKPWFTPTPCHWSQGPSEKLTPTAGQRSCPEPRAQHTPGYCHSGRAKGFFQALAQPLWGQHSSLFGDFSFLICETETIIVSSSNVWGLNGKQAADVGSILGSGRSPGEGNSNPLRILAWEIPWTEEPGEGVGVHGVAKSWTWLSNLNTTTLKVLC